MAGAAAELCARDVARRSILHGVLGLTLPAWSVVAAAVLAAAAVHLLRGRARAHTGGSAWLLFAVLFTAGVAFQLQLGARLQSDGFYYFAYIRSAVFDGDLDFSNDYRLLGLGDKPHLFAPTKTNHAQSAATVGPAIIWAPFFAAGHAVAVRLSVGDPAVSTNGISFPYRQAVCIAGLFYGLLGCWFMYRFAAHFFTRALAAAACAVTVAGSFMLWYLIKEPSMTHAPSMAAVAGFAWAWAATRGRRTLVQWTLLGLIGGFMTLLRWQNALFAVLPASEALLLLLGAWRRSDRRALNDTLAGGVMFTTAAAVAFLPQMFAWRAIYGSWFAVSPIGPQIRLTDPQLVDILWSSRNGLFSTTPVLYFGGLGLLLFAFVRPAIGGPALLAVALMTYFNASIQDWWGSDAYGGRRFDGTLPFFCLGVACLAERALVVVRRAPAAAVVAAAALLVLWNLTLMAAAQAGIVRIGETIAFGEVMPAQARIVHGWFGNPFTYPASLLFAVRNDVSPAAYDLLAPNRFLGDPQRQYGRIDIGGDDEWLLREGWHQPEKEGSTTFRWASNRAVVLVPLDRAAPLRVQVRLHAFAVPDRTLQTITLYVNGSPAGQTLPVTPEWGVAETVVSVEAWRAGVNRVALQFRWERRPSDVGMGGDTRPLSAAVDYVRVAVPE